MKRIRATQSYEILTEQLIDTETGRIVSEICKIVEVEIELIFNDDGTLESNFGEPKIVDEKVYDYTGGDND